MLLDPKKSLCSTNQSVVISRDKGQKTEHRAENPSGKYSIRHYKLDGVLIQQEECCDFLLLNDPGYKSYYIELKGQDVKKAVEQVLAAERKCKSELYQYLSHYRIVVKKAPVQRNFPKNYRDLLADVGTRRLKLKTMKMEEVLE
jgi:hypothetical protein